MSKPICDACEFGLRRGDAAADWALIGDAGNFYLCDYHYRLAPPSTRDPRWRRIKKEHGDE